MPTVKQQRILVVGAGVAGLAAACGLRQQGHLVSVVERVAPPGAPEGDLQPRVSAFSPASQAFLAQINAWPNMPERVRAYTNMWVWTEGDFDHIHFSASEMAKPCLGHIAENGQVQFALYQVAINLGVEFHFNTEWSQLNQSDSAVALTLADETTLKADWLVVAEGAQSGLRERLGVASRGWRYQQQALVCSIKWAKQLDTTKPAVAETAWQRFLETGPLALLPLATDESSLVWSLDAAEFDRLRELDDEAFVKALNQALGGCVPAEAISVGRRFSFPLQMAQAEQYRSGRCLLVGDAAHSVHPLAGQGLNLGILDSRDLVAAFGSQSLEPALASWERKRKAKAAELMALTDGLYRAYRIAQQGSKSGQGFWQKNRGKALRTLLSGGMALVGGSGLLKQQLARLALSSD